MAERLISLALTVAAIYAILAATYVLSCLVVDRMNRRIASAKIQRRATPAAQIRRDRSQSLVSLAAIAACGRVSLPAGCSDGSPSARTQTLGPRSSPERQR